MDPYRGGSLKCLKPYLSAIFCSSLFPVCFSSERVGQLGLFFSLVAAQVLELDGLGLLYLEGAIAGNSSVEGGR